MAGDDTGSSTPIERPVDRLSSVSDTALLKAWRGAARSLAAARVRYSQEFMRAKIAGKDRSDGLAHQIAIEVTADEVTVLSTDLDIIKAIWYRRGGKNP